MKRFILLFVLLFSILGCVKYKQISFQPADLKSNKRFEKNIERYTIIVHQDEKVGILENQTIVDNSIKGKIRAVPRDSIVEQPITSESVLKHRKDVHIYMSGQESFEVPEVNGYRNIDVRFDDVKEIKAFSSNETDIIGKFFLVAGAVLLVFLALILLFVLLVSILVLAFTNAFSNTNNNTNNGSNSNSGGSGGSNSTGSGGSNSGGSNSGGSNSGNSAGSGSSGSGSGVSSSGCYIATMAYGDYDHPQVYKLREFRDETLAKSKSGRRFIQLYYKYSPKVVEKTKGFKVLHKVIRGWLNVMILLIRK